MPICTYVGRSLLTQAELEASMTDHNMLPVIAARPFYGKPEDAPARPPIFSGIQYKLPTAALTELQPFGSRAAPSALNRLKADKEDLQVGSRLKLGWPLLEDYYDDLHFWGAMYLQAGVLTLRQVAVLMSRISKKHFAS